MIKKFFILFLLSYVGAVVKAADFSIVRYGALGDGIQLNTKSIQNAIDDCHQAGGGKVIFPPGNFLSGTLVLKDHVTLHFERGSVLLGSTELKDYQNLDPFTEGLGIDVGWALLVAVDVKNIRIEGLGIINGQGAAIKAKHILTDTRPESQRWGLRPFLLRVVRCNQVSVEGVTLQYAGAWTSHYYQTTQLSIKNVKIHSVGVAHNDGIGIDGCQDVIIENCDVVSGDDALVFKTTSSKMTCKNIVVKGLRLKSNQAGIKMGTESMAAFQQIHISDCHIYDTKNGGIKLLTVDGANVEDVVITDITMDNVRTPMLFRLGSRLSVFRKNTDIKQTTGTFENVLIKNVKAKAAADAQIMPPSGVLITGVPGHYIKGLTLENVEIDLDGGGTVLHAIHQVPEAVDQYPEVKTFGPIIPAYGIWARHVEGLKLINVKLNLANNDQRPAFICEDGRSITIDGLELPLVKNAQSIIRLENVKKALITSVKAKGSVEKFVRISGTSKDINIVDNNLEELKVQLDK